MAAGIFALLDDIAVIAKTTAGSIDDVAAGAAKASANEVRSQWATMGSSVGLKICDAGELEAHGKVWPRRAIRDAGLTEIVPFTLTAVTFLD